MSPITMSLMDHLKQMENEYEENGQALPLYIHKQQQVAARSLLHLASGSSLRQPRL